MQVTLHTAPRVTTVRSNHAHACSSELTLTGSDGMPTVPDMVSSENEGQRVCSQDSGPLLRPRSPTSNAGHGLEERPHSLDAAPTSDAHSEAEQLPGSFDELMDDDVLPAYSP